MEALCRRWRAYRKCIAWASDPISGLRLAHHALVKLALHTHGENSTDVRSFGVKIAGSKRSVHLRDLGADADLFREIFIKDEYLVARRIVLGESPLIVDAGANIGLAALYLSNTYPGARLIGFEPSASEYAIAKLNYSGCGDSQIHNWAVGSSKGEAVLAVNPQESPAQRIIGEEDLPEGYSGQTTEVVRISDVLDAMGGEAPSLLKLDVEGYEVHALVGMGGYLKRTGAVIAETHSEELHQASLELLRDVGFEVCWTMKQGEGLYLLAAVNPSSGLAVWREEDSQAPGRSRSG